jgi:hypothetical protein
MNKKKLHHEAENSFSRNRITNSRRNSIGYPFLPIKAAIILASEKSRHPVIGIDALYPAPPGARTMQVQLDRGGHFMP